MWALIINETVVEITKIDPNNRFHPLMQWVPCPESTQQGDGFKDGAFQPLPPSPVALTVQIASMRYQYETAGLVFEGLRIDTSLDGQARITAAALSAVLDTGYVCTWKTLDGMVEMRADQLIRLAAAVRAYVQACFDRERDLLAAVEDGSFTAEQLHQGWPDRG